MTSELHQAYALLARFKEGKVRTGNRVTPRQLRLVRLLIEDLVPRTKLPKEIDGDLFAKIISDLCEENARWNKRFMRAIVLASDAHKAGRRKEGLAHLDAFIEECPSDWYRMHAGAAKKDMQRQPDRK
jgi:hypothetical protein